MMQVTYNSWWRRKKRAQSDEDTLCILDSYNKTQYSKRKSWEDILEEASRAAHENRQIYFVTIYKNEKPYCFLEINNDFIGVSFLDDKSREYLSYSFKEIEPNKLFLSKAIYWEFDEQTDKETTSTTYQFTQDGDLRIIKMDMTTNESEIKEAENKIDVLGNYEEYPVFGDYKAIINKERLMLQSDDWYL